VRPVVLIANPASGGGKVLRLLPAVESRLAELGIPFRTQMTRSLEHARELAVQAADEGAVATSFSGDGVAGAVAGALAGRDDALVGVLPGGTGNDFCRHVGIPADPVDACHVLLHGEPRPIDLGEADGRPFLGIASTGFDSSANEIANAAPRWLGRGIYVYGALAAIARWSPATFTVELDGGERVFEGWSVIVANTSVYGAGMYVAPDARLDDGLLDVVTIGRSSRLRFAATLPKVFKGTHVTDPLVTVQRAREVRISASRPFDVYADGDPIAALPSVVRALPGAVRVLLPAS
jgi:YegS/Rv2252/BmrU family lipid kinase